MENENDKIKNIDMKSDILDFSFDKRTENIIKVVGVGGGGGNAVTHMYKEGIHDVSFALCNTDAQALANSPITTKLQLGKGLGAGNKPEVARDAADETSDKIKAILNDGTKMAFITAGMGGGTGTGASPVVAGISRSLDILTIGIVTLPFLFEGRKKIIQALKGVENLSKNVDALLVINNERLRDNFADLTMPQAFAKADNTLTIAAKGIAEIITVNGVINLDFADVRTVLKDGGVAIMSSSLGEGPSRLEDALESAIKSPLLNNNDVFGAKKILFNIYTSSENPLVISETNAIEDFTQQFDQEVEVIWGNAIDESLDKQVKITLLAAGFGVSNIPGMDLLQQELSDQELEEEEKKQKIREEENRLMNQRIEEYYGKNTGLEINQKSSFVPKPEVLTEEQMNNDKILDRLEDTPVYKRDSTFKVEDIDPQNKKNKNLFD